MSLNRVAAEFPANRGIGRFGCTGQSDSVFNGGSQFGNVGTLDGLNYGARTEDEECWHSGTMLVL